MNRLSSRQRDALALAGVLLAALLLRLGNLGLIHDRGDQMIFAALARHIAASGMAGYTIQHVDDGTAPIAPGVALHGFWPNPEGKGTVVSGLVASGEGYWDRPLANQPPVFPLVLVGSHALLGAKDDQFPLLGRAADLPGATHDERVLAEERFARAVARDPPPGAVRRQLWATLPVLLSDLATVALTFVLARRLGGSRRAALVAAALFACDPLALYAAHRVLSNSTLAMATVAAGLALLATERDSRYAPLAGALAGFACLVKASAIFLLPVPTGWRRPVYWTAGLLVLAPWSIVCFRILGHPLGLAWQSQKDWQEASAWAQLVTSRDVLFYATVLARSPLLVVGLASCLAWLGRRATPEDRARRSLAVFVLLVLAAAHFHSGGKEGRHILHVYPFLAIAASEWVDRARRASASRPLVLVLVPVLLLVIVIVIVLSLGSIHGLHSAFATAAVPP